MSDITIYVQRACEQLFKCYILFLHLVVYEIFCQQHNILQNCMVQSFVTLDHLTMNNFILLRLVGLHNWVEIIDHCLLL